MNSSNSNPFLEKVGPMDGLKFFARSPFKSIPFVANTLICSAGIIVLGWILYEDWQKLSSPMIMTLLVLVNGGLISNWYRALRHIDRIQELVLAGYFPDVQPGSPIGLVFDNAADAINGILFFCSSTIVFMLLIIRHLLK